MWLSIHHVTHRLRPWRVLWHLEFVFCSANDLAAALKQEA